MNQRLKLVRKTLGVSQSEFSKSINITDSYLSKLENNARELGDRVIQLVCLKYNVNENWLRTGDGEMFNRPKQESKPTDKEIAERYLLNALRQLSPEYQAYFQSVCEKFLREQNASKDNQK